MLVLIQCDFVNLVDTNTFQITDKNIVLLKHQDIFFKKKYLDYNILGHLGLTYQICNHDHKTMINHQEANRNKL
jgi:hypothetical protein